MSAFYRAFNAILENGGYVASKQHIDDSYLNSIGGGDSAFGFIIA